MTYLYYYGFRLIYYTFGGYSLLICMRDLKWRDLFLEIKKEEVPVIEICSCPNCKGQIVEKKSRKGKIFYGCNNYPKCKTAYWYKPVDRKCPECGEMLLEKGKKIVCSNDACSYEDE